MVIVALSTARFVKQASRGSGGVTAYGDLLDLDDGWIAKPSAGCGSVVRRDGYTRLEEAP
jgi:hypothetical protein